MQAWSLEHLAVAQGSVRDNLDPMGRHSDRELIAVLKSTRLWDILCGVSLSQSKGLARTIAAQSPAPQQGSVPQPPRSASRPIQPRSPTAGSLRAGAHASRLCFGDARYNYPCQDPSCLAMPLQTRCPEFPSSAFRHLAVKLGHVSICGSEVSKLFHVTGIYRSKRIL